MWCRFFLRMTVLDGSLEETRGRFLWMTVTRDGRSSLVTTRLRERVLTAADRPARSRTTVRFEPPAFARTLTELFERDTEPPPSARALVRALVEVLCFMP